MALVPLTERGHGVVVEPVGLWPRVRLDLRDHLGIPPWKRHRLIVLTPKALAVEPVRRSYDAPEILVGTVVITSQRVGYGSDTVSGARMLFLAPIA